MVCAVLEYSMVWPFIFRTHKYAGLSLSIYIYITSSTTSPIEPLARAIGERSFASQKLW